MGKSLRSRIELVRRFGLPWVLWRAAYAFKLRSGLLKRGFPAATPDELRLSRCVQSDVPSDPQGYKQFRQSDAPAFFFALGAPPTRETLERVTTAEARQRTIAVADDYCAGRFLYYSRHVHDLGWPVDWMRNPFAGGRHAAEAHWCDYPTFSPERGDIKDVWEPSRFACAYWLLRAYALTRDEKYPAAFWALVESWIDQNPPNRGPNYKCGQETGLRVMAWCFGLYGFWSSPETTADRVSRMAAMIAVQAERIFGNIAFAISQKNNHSISEACGLLTSGLLFPEMRGAARWLRRGVEVLEADARRQIYDDGSFVQHSMNYHRVMLHDYLWAVRLAEVNSRPLSGDLCRRVALAGRFLFEMLDEASGRAPNHGANDGALVLPLASTDYRDYRATVQAATVLETGSRRLAAGPWDEMALWLFGERFLEKPSDASSPSSRRLDSGGYYTIRGDDGWCMVRCHTYRDRPVHVDMLHADIWHRGVNVAGDSGTYKYFAPESAALEKYFKSVRAHNTIEIDDSGPLDLFSRFLWLPWPGAVCTEHAANRFTGRHDAYKRPPWNAEHLRSVELTGDGQWVVTDEVIGQGEHHVKLRWHLVDGRYHVDHATQTVTLEPVEAQFSVRIQVRGPAGLRMDIQRGMLEGDSVAGWESSYYAEKSARPTLLASGTLALPVTITTTFAFEDKAGA